MHSILSPFQVIGISHQVMYMIAMRSGKDGYFADFIEKVIAEYEELDTIKVDRKRSLSGGKNGK